MNLKRLVGVLALLLAHWAGYAQQSPQRKSDSTARKETTATETSGVRELFYLAVAPKETLRPIPRAPVPAPAVKSPSPGAPAPEAASPEATVHLGIRYNLLLVDEFNRNVPIDADHVFHNGDHVALQIESNHSGYLYVLDRQSSGAWRPLVPSDEMIDESNIIDPGKPMRVPASYDFVISDPPGAEHLAVVFARDPQNIRELYQAIVNQKPGSAPSNRPPSSEMADSGMNKAMAEIQEQFGTRDIKIQKVADPVRPGETPNSVYIAHASGLPSSCIFYEFDIRHR